MLDMSKFGLLFGGETHRFQPDVPKDFALPARIPGSGAAPELCQLLTDYDVARQPDEAVVDLKADGIRHLWIGGMQVTREGTPFHAASHVRRALDELERSYGKPMFFDGEYVNDDGLEAAIGDFRRGHGSGTVWLFDAVPLDVWERNGPTAPLIERRAMLAQRGANCLGPALGMLKPLDLGRGGLLLKLDEIVDLGFEGLVVKDARSQYDRRRSDHWMKLKLKMTAECRIRDVGLSNDGFLKHLLVDFNGRTQKIGSGFTKQHRQQLAIAAGDLTGRNALIQYSGTTAGGAMRDASFVALEG